MVAESDMELVSFDSPPVEEVAFAAEFVDPVLAFRQLAALSDAVKAEFPVVQVQPPLGRMSESPGIRIGTSAVMPRLWFVAPDGHRLIQGQEDRFALNWRRLGKPVDYPRYPSLRADFQRWLAVIDDIVGTAPEIGTVELTYVNELRPGESKVGGSDPSRQPHLSLLVNAVSDQEEREFLGKVESQSWSGRWTIPPNVVGVGGGLEARVQHGSSKKDGQPVYLLTMSCRMSGSSALDRVTALGSLDWAHEWIVRGFADLTTPLMHQEWGRTR